MALPIALQLYSVRDQLEIDYLKTLKSVKAMGYDGVELAGLSGYKGKEVKAMLDEVGLQIMSSHVPLPEMLQASEATFREYKEAGCSYVAVPWLPEERRPEGELFEQTIQDILMLGKVAKDNGIQLLYHNHDFEFALVNGKYALDIIYETIPAEYLGVQLDTCWAKVAGLNPVDYLKKYQGRADLVHLKDFYLNGKLTEAPYKLIGKNETKIEKPQTPSFEFRPVGYGMQDIPAIVKAAESIGSKWLIVEQDNSTERPTLDAAKMSIDYLRNIQK